MAASTETQQSMILNTVQQEITVRRQQKAAITRQDSRLSVKSLIESIEKTTTQPKVTAGSRCSSSSSINSITSDVVTSPTIQNVVQNGINHDVSSAFYI